MGFRLQVWCTTHHPLDPEAGGEEENLLMALLTGSPLTAYPWERTRPATHQRGPPAGARPAPRVLALMSALGVPGAGADVSTVAREMPALTSAPGSV